ncbi:DUF1572 family protein [Ferruginibacter paludis]|uniref:DinB family protein n=1 Tax=Ferruginibacter paludis TaxID=1310417 RepID=UPI0025B5E4F4|nr:DUF1572 family protein [Ferruginibacter paludis]MDN3656797.1 DUF1572 family protein [Ferruginibacter paludis]
MITDFKNLYSRDLTRLKTEIALYNDEKSLWLVDKGIANSAGNLCLHLIGNLNAYIGAGLAKTGYERYRDLEFSQKNTPQKELIKMIEDTMRVVEMGLNSMSENQLQEDFPVVIWDKPTEMGYTLIHLLTHLNYHLGQINYHRRLLSVAD